MHLYSSTYININMLFIFLLCNRSISRNKHSEKNEDDFESKRNYF